MMNKKDYLHNPPHIFLDNAVYFVTASIYKKRPLLSDPNLKWQLLDIMKTTFDRLDWEFQHWVILDNHYHLLVKSKLGNDLSKIMRNIHSVSGYKIKQITQAENPIWWNFWDYCPRDEADYFKHLNYLFNNPVKHGYVANLHDYAFSSFHQYFEQQGRESLVRQFRTYADFRNLSFIEDDI